LARPELESKAIAAMSRLNEVGAELAERGFVKGAVDVTGFGLLSHLGAMCASSHVSAEIEASSVPVISEEVFDLIAQGCIPGGSRDNLSYANEFTEWDGTSNVQKALLTDAQTSGGLLLCVPQKRLSAVLKLLKARRARSAATSGRIVRAAKPRIRVFA
jgi:selenide,water dikinase